MTDTALSVLRASNPAADLDGTEILEVTQAGASAGAIASQIRDYVHRFRPVTALTISVGVVDIDLSLGQNFTLALTADVTSVTFSNLPGSGFVPEVELEITQDATGGHGFTLPASFHALGGSDTAIASAANSTTVLSAKSFDNGTTWRYAMQESA